MMARRAGRGLRGREVVDVVDAVDVVEVVEVVAANANFWSGIALFCTWSNIFSFST
jgi:hypothetical protein